jgi:hypothetical protein
VGIRKVKNFIYMFHTTEKGWAWRLSPETEEWLGYKFEHSCLLGTGFFGIGSCLQPSWGRIGVYSLLGSSSP